MASYMAPAITNLENSTTIMNGKNANQIDTEKTALGDIKNAPLPSVEEKLSVKKVHVETTNGETIDREFASSEYVDYHEVWAQKCTLTDDEVNRWITMLNTARDMNPYDETRPPTPPYLVLDDEIQQTIDDDAFPAPITPPLSPTFNSTGYFSSDDTENVHDDTETSDLDKSVFELEINSDNEWIMG